MPQDVVVPCPQGTWTQLTNANVTTSISIELLTDSTVLLKATSDTTPPTTKESFTLEGVGDGWSRQTIAEMFPGVNGAQRLWAYPIYEPSRIAISHA